MSDVINPDEANANGDIFDPAALAQAKPPYSHFNAPPDNEPPPFDFVPVGGSQPLFATGNNELENLLNSLATQTSQTIFNTPVTFQAPVSFAQPITVLPQKFTPSTNPYQDATYTHDVLHIPFPKSAYPYKRGLPGTKTQLSCEDLEKIANNLPAGLLSEMFRIEMEFGVRALNVNLYSTPDRCCVIAGGAIRDILIDRTPQDIDVFFSKRQYMNILAYRLCEIYKVKMKKVRKNIIIKIPNYPKVQLIGGSFHPNPKELIKEFDCPINSSAIFFNAPCSISDSTDMAKNAIDNEFDHMLIAHKRTDAFLGQQYLDSYFVPSFLEALKKQEIEVLRSHIFVGKWYFIKRVASFAFRRYKINWESVRNSFAEHINEYQLTPCKQMDARADLKVGNFGGYR